MRTRRTRTAALVAALAVGLALGGCSSQPPSSATANGTNTGTAPTPAPKSAAPVTDATAEDFSRQPFRASTAIDNEWSPLRPGMRYVYDGSALDGKTRTPRRIVYTVTDLTKVVGGIQSVVLWVTDYDDGELVEAELAFRAQDDDGNIWHLGEYPEEYEEGKFVKAPAWIEGLAGATAGIAMPAHPRLGMPDYAQGFAPPPIAWADRARVHEAGVRTCVPAGCYNDVLVMEEFETAIPGAGQTKFYAPGVGLVRVGWTGPNEEEKEVLELVEVTELGPDELTQARNAALALEKRAYRNSKDVYGRTEPAVPVTAAG